MDLKRFDVALQSALQDPNLETFAESRFGNITRTTGGWASNCKLYFLNLAMLYLEQDEQYLEIGSYQGRSIVGALYQNETRAQVIDPFELFLPDGLAIYNEWRSTISRFGIADRITLHKTLCQNFDKPLPPIGVFYYDGDHDSGHTYEGLKKFERYLSRSALIIVDDYSIFGGPAQRPYPGHEFVMNNPVEVDVNRWLAETPKAKLVTILPWENKSAVIYYEDPGLV